MHCEYSWFQEVKDCRVLSKNQAQEINFLEIKKHINVFAQFKNARILLISPNLNDYFFGKEIYRPLNLQYQLSNHGILLRTLVSHYFQNTVSLMMGQRKSTLICVLLKMSSCIYPSQN